MTLKTSRLDLAELLETEKDIQEFLAASLEECTSEEFIHALGTAARARGMTEVARQAGVTRASLYKSLSKGGNPQFDTIARLCDVFGMKLTATPKQIAAHV